MLLRLHLFRNYFLITFFVRVVHPCLAIIKFSIFVMIFSAIQKALHSIWKSHISSSSTNIYFYYLPGDRWGPLTCEFFYFLQHSIDNSYFPILITDTNKAHSIQISNLQHDLNFLVIDSSEFVDSLDLQPSEKKLLHFPCDNYSLWLNYCAKFPALCIPQSQKRQQFKYFPSLIYFVFSFIIQSLFTTNTQLVFGPKSCITNVC